MEPTSKWTDTPNETDEPRWEPGGGQQGAGARLCVGLESFLAGTAVAVAGSPVKRPDSGVVRGISAEFRI
jgi:hypothetical protein